MIHRSLRHEHTAYVTQPIGSISDNLTNIRIGFGVDAHLRVDANLTVYTRGAHAIRMTLTPIRDDPDAREITEPDVICLSLSDAAALHELLGDALTQAAAIDHAAGTAKAGQDSDQGVATVIRLATNAPEDKEDQQQ